MRDERKHSGRPPKFDEASRPVTTTLPESTLQQLEAINGDRARAIAKAAAMATRGRSGKTPPVEVVGAFPGQAMVVVGPSASLRRLEWLRLIEIAPSRFLLAVPPGTLVETLEVALDDLLEQLTTKDRYERELLSELHKVLRHRRRQRSVSKVEILLLQMGKTLPGTSAS
jgi:hypothetical protein